jgi:formylglycine-generating enzyme required for sulfatase activity
VRSFRLKLALLSFGITALPAADFRKDVQPVLEQNCTACHGSIKQLGGVRLDTPSGFEKTKPSAVLAVVESGAMPPGEKLAPEALAALRDWLKSGAPWPSGVVIATGGAGAGGADNLALARLIHARITSVPPPAKMAAYKTTIPRTDVTYEMVPVPAGDFRMGTPDSEAGRKKDEGPVHPVHIEAFWMSAREVTWDEYRLFMFANQAGEPANKDPRVDAVSRPTRPYVEMSFGMGINGYPAISMTQHAANKYAEWLSAKTGEFYRLPTEAEWEYACRAGSQTAFPWGDDASKLGEYGWFADNSDGKYQKGGSKKPNAWGLYDMLGNVMEWTLDQYAPYTDSGKVVNEPWVKATKPYPHSVRGGSWADDAEKCRCGSRVASDPTWKQQDPQLPKSIWYHTDAQGLGFRLVRPLKVPGAEEMYRYWNSGVESDR